MSWFRLGTDSIINFFLDHAIDRYIRNILNFTFLGEMQEVDCEGETTRCSA